ncbi:PilZ domain-containing protein [Paenibacillus xylaniclasticus]|uniref:PilZ domain-containing protein n=1 Tax=Paenibacillus xylaniclasticus TaxID=588083 RepID=UPI000FDADF31|nr:MULTISPECIES: PilZ domain-containing protein [Paenibacillus]GFN29844.1 hypothetical protein PCURB6_01040 [Paenibacillus curdlanolyticus]
MIIGSRNRNHYLYPQMGRMRVVMSINSVSGVAVQSRKIDVIPAHIHSFGIQFVTKLDLPVHGRYTICLELSSRHYRRAMTAVVVWKRETEGGYLYGCSFRRGERLHMSIRHSWEEERIQSQAVSLYMTYDRKGIARNVQPNHGLSLDVTG